ncbi:TetR/AcrR family transcriptional regulator [Streptomyces tateyamensis]|uniref:TetR/AcrR family transcriptional regulator n=1 Tax=Streptomyces tateyamensis TaxID=565073 RepID=A0A2V4NT77_9ACTN|nr:TetR/AcrR family transcriptional regulator [Streptomyces tateyamensis]PYC79476.1 TetR/AcrR family transcriptional regulator [Streptomyces tateyamensis]
MERAKRGYSSPLRAEQSLDTRRRVLAAATALLLEHGYLGTTLAAVARAAGVSVQTVYNTVGGKPALLRAVYDTALAGEDEPVPMAARPPFRAMIEADSGPSCLGRYARIARTLHERVLPLVVMVLAQAATGDPDLRAFADTIEAERAAGTAQLARHLDARFGLRPGLDPAAAADQLWALTAPELADRLVNRRQWGWDRFEQWLVTTLTQALLEPDR